MVTYALGTSDSPFAAASSPHASSCVLRFLSLFLSHALTRHYVSAQQRTFLKDPTTKTNIPIYAIGLSLYESLPGTTAEQIGEQVVRTQWLWVLLSFDLIHSISCCACVYRPRSPGCAFGCPAGISYSTANLYLGLSSVRVLGSSQLRTLG
jgi:hypothetical protein